MAFSENSKKVYAFVRDNEGKDITVGDVAEGGGSGVKRVNGIVSGAVQRKGLMKRTPAEIELEDGSHKAVKLVSLTEEGKTVDINAKD